MLRMMDKVDQLMASSTGMRSTTIVQKSMEESSSEEIKQQQDEVIDEYLPEPENVGQDYIEKRQAMEVSAPVIFEKSFDDEDEKESEETRKIRFSRDLNSVEFESETEEEDRKMEEEIAKSVQKINSEKRPNEIVRELGP